MTNQLLSITEVAARITAGRVLVLAGEETLLSQLPPGSWVAGTTPYFMTGEGGCRSKDRIFLTDLTDQALGVRLLTYDAGQVGRIYSDAGENEVSLIIVPSGTAVLREFAINAPDFPAFAMHPLIGWVSGVDPHGPVADTAKVFCGGPAALSDCAVVLRFRLPVGHYARIDTINLFRPDDGDILRFPEAGFSAETVLVNARPRRLVDYIKERAIDTRLPLVADFNGTMINVAFRAIDPAGGKVEFFAPVWPHIEYRLAVPVGDYPAEFQVALQRMQPGEVLFSCNCILNYLYSQLEGRQTGSMVGPVTFGEIAYQLLTQTLACLTVVQASSPQD